MPDDPPKLQSRADALGTEQLQSRADALRAKVGALLAPVLFVVVWFTPLPLPTPAHRLAAIAVAVMVAWVTEVLPIPVTALLVAPAMVAAGITDAKTAFAPYADPLLFLFFGSFFIAEAMRLHGLDRRLAYTLVQSRLIAGIPSRMRLGMMLAGMLLSMWISNTASTAILMPILLGTAFAANASDKTPAAGASAGGAAPVANGAMTGSLLAIAYACSVGGMGTLVGTTPNLITVGLLKRSGTELSFFDWSSIGFPTALAITAAIYLLFSRLFPLAKAPKDSAGALPPSGTAPRNSAASPSALTSADHSTPSSHHVSTGSSTAPESTVSSDRSTRPANHASTGSSTPRSSSVPPDAIEQQGDTSSPNDAETPGGSQQPAANELAFGPWSKGEKVTALAFGIAVLGWTLPGALKAASSPWAAPISRALPAGGVAILASSVLFMFRDKSGPTARPVLPWSEARRIDWGLIMLFGGGLSLGSQMFATGLARDLGRGFLTLTGIESVWALVALATVFTIFFTEVCSNTATSSMLVPLVIGVSDQLNVSPVAPSVAVGLAASCAFMMPIATGPNAIVYGTGRVPLMSMVRAGILLNVLCAAIVFAVIRILCPLFGWV